MLHEGSIQQAVTLFSVAFTDASRRSQVQLSRVLQQLTASQAGALPCIYNPWSTLAQAGIMHLAAAATALLANFAVAASRWHCRNWLSHKPLVLIIPWHHII
jgi:hypothetical protein